MTVVGFTVTPLAAADTYEIASGSGYAVARLVTTGTAATLKLYQGSVDSANLLTTLDVSATRPSVDEQGFPVRYTGGLIAVMDEAAEGFVGIR